MKKILTIAAIFCALSAFGQITSTGGVVYLVEGDIMAYTTPTIIINPTFNKDNRPSFNTRAGLRGCNNSSGI